MPVLERLLPVKNINHRVFVFTVHKAASLGVYEVMRQVALVERWPISSANLKTPNLREPKNSDDHTFAQQVADRRGFVGPIRLPVPVDGLFDQTDKIIVHLRDPRDVLVSMFYSWAFSHPGVKDVTREKHRQVGIDAFVLGEAAALKKKYLSYIDDFLPLPQTTLLLYEDFVCDRPGWLGAFLKSAGADPDRRRYKKLAQENRAAEVTKEDVNAHIRKAAPGDHREKLGQATIDELNTQLKDVLAALKY